VGLHRIAAGWCFWCRNNHDAQVAAEEDARRTREALDHARQAMLTKVRRAA
jgi:hypothetical protein